MKVSEEFGDIVFGSNGFSHDMLIKNSAVILEIILKIIAV